jgi:hypothetical protein
MGARGLIVGRCQTPLCWSRHRAGLEVQVALHLRRLDSRHSGCRRTAYVTDYECVCADVGDAGATQQPKFVRRPKIDFHVSSVWAESPIPDNDRTSKEIVSSFNDRFLPRLHS